MRAPKMRSVRPSVGYQRCLAKGLLQRRGTTKCWKRAKSTGMMRARPNRHPNEEGDEALDHLPAGGPAPVRVRESLQVQHRHHLWQPPKTHFLLRAPMFLGEKDREPQRRYHERGGIGMGRVRLTPSHPTAANKTTPTFPLSPDRLIACVTAMEFQKCRKKAFSSCFSVRGSTRYLPQTMLNYKIILL